MDNKADTRNIIPKYKNDNERHWQWTEDLIKKDLQAKAFPYAVLVENWQSDFNLSSCIRNANVFGASNIYYLGNKHYDKRGAVGSYLYTDVVHLKTTEELIQLKGVYTFVGVENNINGSVALDKYKHTDLSLFIFGSEGVGISEETIKLCDKFVHIPQFGSVRSLNAAVASGIIMNSFVEQYNKRKDA